MSESDRFGQYMEHLAKGLGHAGRHAGLNDYCTGLMLPLACKSVEPMGREWIRFTPAPGTRHCITSWLKPTGPMKKCYAGSANGWCPGWDLSGGGFWIIADTRRQNQRLNLRHSKNRSRF